MKHSWRIRGWLHRSSGAPRARPATRAERGQALMVIALATIGLLAFIGLTVDAGILFIGEGHLRRAVDAASLAAAGQFRVGASSDRLQLAAAEVVHLNGVDPTTLILGICAQGPPPDPHNDDSLCPVPGAPHRKLVKVTATTEVRFAFLSIIGIPSTTIVANSTSEAASVDVVLVIDTSNSMTFDAARGLITDTTNMWYPNYCNSATPSDPATAAAGFKGNCLPFLYVKQAAVNFINHLYFPYDRLSIVTFDNVPTVQLPLTNTLSVGDITNWVKGDPVSGIGDGTAGLQVSLPRDPNIPSPQGIPCSWSPPAQPNPSDCTNTSTGGGLRLAGGEFGRKPIRQEAVWVVILLTDGAANASAPAPSPTGPISNRWCPQSTWWDSVNDPHDYNPFCRDFDPTTRHTLLDPHVYVTSGIDPTHTVPYNPQNTYDPTGVSYDADDYARDGADFVACPSKLAQAPKWCRDSLDYTKNQGGQGAIIFAIGLGGLLIDNSQGGGVMVNGVETRILPSDPRAGYAAGDALLRYIANVGLDGNPDPSLGPDACQGVLPPPLQAQPDPKAPTLLNQGNQSYTCGNYYFSQFGTGLSAVFQSIASRIFTRITQ